VSTLWVDGLRYTLLTFAPFLLLMSVLYLNTRNQLNPKAE
jgi:hypothetical protein